MIFSYDETYLGDLFRADQQGQLEQKISQDLNDAGNAAVDAGAEFADKASDASTIAAAGGIVAAPFTGGGSLALTGYALTAATVADATSTGFKTVDAIAFDGSSDAAFNQLIETGINVGAGKLLNKAAARFAQFDASAGRFVIRATQATRSVPVSNRYGFTVTATRDATKLVLVPIMGEVYKNQR